MSNSDDIWLEQIDLIQRMDDLGSTSVDLNVSVSIKTENPFDDVVKLRQAIVKTISDFENEQ